MDAPAPGGLGGTYAGSPIACAAALAVLDVIEEEQLCERAEAIGAHDGAARCAPRRSRCPRSAKCAGSARWWRWNSCKNGDAHQPDADLTKALVKHAAAQGPRAALVRPLRQRHPFPRAADGVGRDRARKGLGIVLESLRELTASRPASRR